MAESAGDSLCEFERLLLLDPSPLDPIVKALAFDEFHRDVDEVPVLSEIEGADDVWMTHLGQGSRFPLESQANLLVLSELWRKDFQRHDLPQSGVLGAVDGSHPAISNMA